MPAATIASAMDLYYEETGQGFPLVWCHEYGGDHRSWEPHAILPTTGHTASIEERAPFNQHVADFLTSVESGRWGTWKSGR